MDWDVLWLGHCGERAQTGDASYIDYHDSTRPTTDQFSGFSKKLWMDEVPDGHRRLQAATQPICTFAYAVTNAGAKRVLELLSNGMDEAYDVGLQDQCRQGDLRCFTVVPQLMQHYEPPAELGYVSIINEESGGGQSSSDEVLEREMGSTGNVVHSARCKALFDAQCLASGTSPDYWGY
jgi:hypothetical protein